MRAAALKPALSTHPYSKLLGFLAFSMGRQLSNPHFPLIPTASCWVSWLFPMIPLSFNTLDLTIGDVSGKKKETV
jgi:hypothetical protein